MSHRHSEHRGGHAPRRLFLLTAASFVLAVSAATVAVSPALASSTPVFKEAFGEPCTVEPCAPGKLKDPSGIAVNNATGDVYVVDKGNNRVEEFNSEGGFLAEFNGSATAGELVEPEAVAVDNSGKTQAEDPSVGDVYVTDHNVVDKFSSAGKYEGQITGTCEKAGEVPSSCKAFAEFESFEGVAVDPQGQVWVYRANAQIDAFSDAQPNAFLSSRGSPLGSASHGFAVDSEDDLYVLHGEFPAKLSSTGTILKAGEQEGTTGLAVDPSSNDVYLVTGEGGEIQAYTPKGFTEGEAPITFGQAQLEDHGGTALAVSYAPVSGGDVYVIDSGAGKVDIFAPPKVTTYAESFHFGDTEPGELSEPLGVAVNDSTELGDETGGDVYVVDKGNERVEQFSKAGAFIRAFAPPGGLHEPQAIAVDNCKNALGETCTKSEDPSVGDVYVTDQLRQETGENGYALNTIDKFSAIGAYEGQLRRCPEEQHIQNTESDACEPTGHPTLAIDFGVTGVSVGPTGNVWVATNEANEDLLEFSDEGAFERRVITDLGVEGLALGPDENGQEFGYIDEGLPLRFNFSTGAAVGKGFGGGGTSALALDPASGELFVDRATSIDRYSPGADSSSGLIEAFPEAGLPESRGLAVNPSGILYATERSEGRVAVFDPYPLPRVAVGAVASLQPQSVTLEGSVNPEGTPVESCQFEYGTTTSYGQIAPCEHPDAAEIGSGILPVEVHADVEGLPSGTTYHYRLVASDAHGTNQSEDQLLVTPGPQIGEQQASTVEATAATLSAQIDPHGAATSYHFEYDTGPYTSPAAHGTSLPVPNAAIGSGDSNVPVEQHLHGLEAGAVYHYRVVAASELELGQISDFDGPDHTFTTPTALGSGPPSGCANEQRRAEQPDAAGLPDCRAYEMVSPVEANGQDATDSFLGTNAVRAAVSGEAVTYTAAGDFAAATGDVLENQFLSRRGPAGWSTQAITPLHEVKQAETEPSYETTAFTPELTAGIAKTNTKLTGEAPVTVAGESELYVNDFAGPSPYRYVGAVSTTPVGNTDGTSTDLSHVLFGEKEVVEWVNGTVVPVGVANNSEDLEASIGSGRYAALAGSSSHWQAVSANGSRVYFTSPAYAAGNPTLAALYVRENVEQPQSPIVSPEVSGTGTLTQGSEAITSLVAAAGEAGKAEAGATELGVSTTLGRFVVDDHITGTGIAPGTKITKISGRVFTISNPTAEKFDRGSISSPGPAPFTVGQSIAGDGIPRGTTITKLEEGKLTLSNAAASSASGVQLLAGGECTVPADACTVDVSAPQRLLANPAGAQPARFQGASADGSRVFFSSKAELTEDAYTGPAINPASNLYEYDLATGRLNDLTVLGTGNGAAVQGVVQISEDGSYVYFVAKGALKGEHGEPLRNASGAEPIGENDNLYLSHDGGAPTFIATLAFNDESDWDLDPEINNAVVTPNGTRLAFMSSNELTGYDNHDASTGQPDDEIYLYDAETNSLACASCNPTGARPLGPSTLPGAPGGALYRPRDLVEDGTLFFDSYDALAPHSSDGRKNVYEYKDGQIHPISDVAGGYESFFLDASASGDDVFFATADRLLPEDQSNNVVVYDARVNGGFPVAPVAPSCDNADSCKPPVSPQPSAFVPTGSATFNGLGNYPLVVSPPPPKKTITKKTVKCKKNFVKKKIKKKEMCVKKKSKKKAKKSSKSKRGGKS